jgi:hypothetical protein
MTCQHSYPEPENQWSRKAQEARQTELQWRVKENVVDTLISFIWFATSYQSCRRVLTPFLGRGYRQQLHYPLSFATQSLQEKS